MVARKVARKVAMYVMGVVLDGFCKADDSHKDRKTGEWRHSSPAVWSCQCRRPEGMCVRGLREHDRVRFSLAGKV
jgi:hypothetical protein